MNFHALLHASHDATKERVLAPICCHCKLITDFFPAAWKNSAVVCGFTWSKTQKLAQAENSSSYKNFAGTSWRGQRGACDIQCSPYRACVCIWVLATNNFCKNCNFWCLAHPHITLSSGLLHLFASPVRQRAPTFRVASLKARPLQYALFMVVKSGQP